MKLYKVELVKSTDGNVSWKEQSTAIRRGVHAWSDAGAEATAPPAEVRGVNTHSMASPDIVDWITDMASARL